MEWTDHRRHARLMPRRVRLTDMLGVAVCLRHMLDAWRHGHPAVHALLVDRERGTRKRQVGERPDRNHDGAFEAFGRVEHRRPAFGTEPECGSRAFVSDTDILLGGARDGHGTGSEASLSPEDTSGPTLAGKAVADRDPNRVGRDVSVKLATTAGGGSMRHRPVGDAWRTESSVPLERPVRPRRQIVVSHARNHAGAAWFCSLASLRRARAHWRITSGNETTSGKAYKNRTE